MWISMAAPQFFTPQRPSRSKSNRRFTLQQANSTLPLVKRIVADIVQVHTAASAVRNRMESIKGKELAEAQRELERTMDHLHDLVAELGTVGAELKDSGSGLIDFMGRHDGRDICLCWKLGEESITHWHELDAGFAGRKPVSLLREKV
jgi:hypothetical protein